MRVSSILAIAFAAVGAVAAPASRRDFCLAYNSQDCRSFDLYEINTNEVENHLNIGSASTMPLDAANPNLKTLTGLFYMMGNPLADDVLSLAGGKWENDAYLLKVYDENIWSWDNNWQGRLLYNSVRTLGLTYKLTYPDGGNVAHVEPLFFLPPYLFNADIGIPEMLANFTIIPTAEPDFFIRRSTFFSGAPSDYQFVRIVREDGTRTPYYQTYLNRVDKPNIGNDTSLGFRAGFSVANHLSTTQLLAKAK